MTDADVEKAEKRMRARMQAQPRAVSARYDRPRVRIVVSLSNGLDLDVPVALAQGLAGAKACDLAAVGITPTGLGLHWPKLGGSCERQAPRPAAQRGTHPASREGTHGCLSDS